MAGFRLFILSVGSALLFPRLALAVPASAVFSAAHLLRPFALFRHGNLGILLAQQFRGHLLGHLALHLRLGLEFLGDTLCLRHLGQNYGNVAGDAHITSPDSFL